MLEHIGEALRKRGWTVATAESCTGGLMADRLTDVAGCSDYFLGGLVAYSNEAKQTLLQVPADVILKTGSVSRECAAAMADGARKAFGAHIGLASTGIAGPSGGSSKKPVGLVFIALSTDNGTYVSKDVWPGGRREVKENATLAALEMLSEYLFAGQVTERA